MGNRIRGRRWSASATGLAASCLLLLGLPRAALAGGEIESLEPAQVMQGSTVMLTLKGKGLPQGSLAVEFYPQQIAVLSILSSDSSEIVIQAKVSSLAPPGQYNLVVYNQLGDEATATGLLTVGSTVSTPVFSSYEPHKADSSAPALAIALNGEMITPEAVAQLRIEWSLGGNRVEGLETGFAYVNPRTSVCTVTGKLPPGNLRGRLLLNQTPIYQIELQVSGEGIAILGHTPAMLSGDDPQPALRLLCSDVGPELAGRLVATLALGEQVISAKQVNGADSSSLSAIFPGPLAPGNYALSVTLDGAVVYGGEVQVSPPQAPEPPSEPAQPQVVEPQEQVPGQVEAVARQVALQINSAPATVADGSANPVAEPAQGAGTVETPAHMPASPPALQPLSTNSGYRCESGGLPRGADPLSLTIRSGKGPSELAGLSVSLTLEGERLDNVLSTVRGDSLICLFAAPKGGWKADADVLVLLRDSSGMTMVEPLDLAADTGSGAKATAPEEVSGAGESSAAVHSTGEGFQFTAQGISFGVDTGQSSPELSAWAAFESDTANPMLKANLPRLKPSAQLLQGAVVSLKLARDPANLPDEAWRLLGEMLRDAGPLTLRVKWPAMGVAAEVTGPLYLDVDGQAADGG